MSAPYLGDFPVNATVYGPFMTFAAAGGSLTFTGTVSNVVVYKNGVAMTAPGGLTLTKDIATGRHRLKVDMSADANYTAGEYEADADGLTIDGQTVNMIAALWSVENRSALRPTTAGRTLDVTATGAAGIDLANVENQGSTLTLSATTIKTATDVETDTADIQSRLPAALTAGGHIKADALAISGDTVAADNLEAAADGTTYNLGGGAIVAASVTGAVGSVTGAVGSVGAGGITAASIATGAIDADAIAADAGAALAAALLDLADGVETGITFRQLLRAVGAALAGQLSGAATTTVTLKAINNAGTTRLVATVDADGNRSAVTLTL